MLKRINTSLLEIAYEERGDANADPVILVHGFPDDAQTWEKVTNGLVAAGYRTFTPYVRGYGATRFLDGNTQRSGQYIALTQDLIEFADALDIDQFILVSHAWGARAAYPAAALYPKRVRALVALAASYGTGAPSHDAKQPVSLAQARAYWYQWYFNLDKGREALASDRRALCRELWKLWSPSWRFSKAAFDKTAVSFDNSDFVDVVIHSYRYRWANAEGDPRYEELVAQLAKAPKIKVPTTVIVGAEDGATLTQASEGKERYFSGSYQRRVLRGVGHFIQREQPKAVVEAILKLARTAKPVRRASLSASR
ncbi:MAG: alpha/beta fold hydrolase [Burkholderiales bacterium]